MQCATLNTVVYFKKLFLPVIFLMWAVVGWALPPDTSAINSKIGFTSLFANNTYNPAKPYLTQLSPKAVPFVQEYIRKQGKELERMKGWGQPYFNLYDHILTNYGVPKEMKYLSVIESHLQSGLRSWAGAVGPWQLMDYEAKRFGLRVGAIDDRLDYTKSTQVAAQLLKELYGEFGDWLLVVAAYNGGAGRIRQAIRKSNSRDFWDLQYFLKEETRTHVKKFIGTHYIFEGGGGLTTMTKDEVNVFNQNNTNNAAATIQQNFSNTDSLAISGRYKGQIIVEQLQLDEKIFQQLNPAFNQTLAQGKTYLLRLPSNKMPQFIANKQVLLMQSIKALLEGK